MSEIHELGTLRGVEVARMEWDFAAGRLRMETAGGGMMEFQGVRTLEGSLPEIGARFEIAELSVREDGALCHVFISLAREGRIRFSCGEARLPPGR